jgi:predicted RNase H-like HicB family nuclease
MNYKVVISEGEDGWYLVECPSIPGCVSQGKTVEEALENIKDAIQGCFRSSQRKDCVKRLIKLAGLTVDDILA